jgi:hypothetical protein
MLRTIEMNVCRVFIDGNRGARGNVSQFCMLQGSFVNVVTVCPSLVISRDRLSKQKFSRST